MRKAFAYISALAAVLLAAVSCGREEVPSQEGDGLIHVNLGISLPAGLETKSHVVGTENPVSSISLLCFNEYGFVGQYAATVTSSGGDPEHGTFTATIPDQTRGIHFVANHPVVVPGNYLGWQQVRMMRNSLFTVNYNDPVAFWGYYHGDSASEVKTYLEDPSNTVYLLRDRAKIELGAQNDNDITSLEWLLTNGLTKGYIAPGAPYANNYWQEGTGAQAGHFFSNAAINPYSSAGRYTASEGAFTQATQPIYLFEDENTLANPVKLILKATYVGGEIRYHDILLMDSTYEQFPIKRSHIYVLTLNKLSKEAGYTSFADALAGTRYSNNQTAQVDQVVQDVTNGTYNLRITDDSGTSVIYQNGGDKSIGFTYTGSNGAGVADYGFRAVWMELDPENDISDGSTPSVTYNPSTGIGTVNFTLGSVDANLKTGLLLLQDTKHGLSRIINVYSITQFTLASRPVLTSCSEKHTVGTEERDVYKLSFTLPENYPSELYPIDASFATVTLNPFSDSSATTAGGSFGVEVRSTSGLTGGVAADSWNYQAANWGYWFNYSIAGSSREVNIYLDDVRSKRGTPASSVGLYLSIPYFGNPMTVTP